MELILAGQKDIDKIEKIVFDTVMEIYPRFYPKGAVDYFIKHHDRSRIEADVAMRCVYYAVAGGSVVGTITVKENEINRFFVLPEFQGNGYGAELLKFAEDKIFKDYDTITLDSSLSGKLFYLKHGFEEYKFCPMPTESGDYLCYDTMIKRSCSD